MTATSYSSWASPETPATHIPEYQINDVVQRIIVAVLMSVISLLGIGGNTLVLLSILLCRKLQTQTNIFVVNLCVADFLTCLTLPFQAAAAVIDVDANMFLFSDGFCAVVSMLEVTCLGCSILTCALIAMNRFVLITKSKTTYRRLCSPLVLVTSLMATWSIPAAAFGVPAIAGIIELSYYPRFRLCAWNESYPLSKYLIGLILILALLITLVCYAKTYLFVRRHARAVESLTPAISRLNVKQSQTSLVETPLAGSQIGIVPQTSVANNCKIKKFNMTLVVENATHHEDDSQSISPSVQGGSSIYEERSCDAEASKCGVEIHSTTNKKSRMKSKSNSRNMEAEISKNLFVVVCLVVISIVPFVTCLSLSSCQEPFIYTVVIICMGSCVNPIVYGFRHPHFRPVFACIIWCRLADIPQPSKLARKILKQC